VQKPGTYSQNKYLLSPAFWSYLGRFLDHWRMAEQRFRFDVLMRGVLLLFCFSPGERGVITLAIEKDALSFLW